MTCSILLASDNLPGTLIEHSLQRSPRLIQSDHYFLASCTVTGIAPQQLVAGYRQANLPKLIHLAHEYIQETPIPTGHCQLRRLAVLQVQSQPPGCQRSSCPAKYPRHPRINPHLAYQIRCCIRSKIDAKASRLWRYILHRWIPEVIHVTDQYANNRAGQSHEASRVRERGMSAPASRRIKTVLQAQRFVTAHAAGPESFQHGQAPGQGRTLSKSE